MLRGRAFCGLVLVALFAAATQHAAQTPSSSKFHLLEATIDGIHASMKSGEITCRRLVDLYLKRIEAYNKTGPAFNSVQNTNSRALQEADRLDGIRAAFADLVRLPSARLVVSAFSLEADALVTPSPLLDELDAAALPTRTLALRSVRIFEDEALALDPFDARAQSPQFLVNSFVAAVQVIDALHQRAASSDQPRDNQGRGGAEIAGHHRRAAQRFPALHDRARPFDGNVGPQPG